MMVYEQPQYYEIAFGFIDPKEQVDAFERLIKKFSQIEVKKFLDIACGLSPTLSALPASRKGDFYGIDYSSEAIERLIVEHPDLKERVCVGDCTKLPYDDDFFETVLLCEIVEHLPKEDII